MNYPVNIKLRKLSTLDDAEFPQQEKYPNGTEREGLMWRFNRPQIGHPFYVLRGKLDPIFRTSVVTEILEVSNKRIKFKTVNSTYEIIIT